MVTPIGEPAWAALVNQAFTLDAQVLEGLSPLLILAPHPDDETLGCGGLIATASRLGLRPRVVYLTDGEASHEGSPTWPPERIAPRRRQEALDALAVLGVPDDDVLFLGWPDGAPRARGLDDYQNSLRTLDSWAANVLPWSVWAPWRRERHCDHVAASVLAADFAKQQNRDVVLMEYLVWAWADPELAHDHGAEGVWGLMCVDEIERRRRALACHQTQLLPIIDDASQAFQLPPELAALTERPVEIFLERKR